MTLKMATKEALETASRLAVKVFGGLRRSHQRRVAIRELRAMPDWQLRDIGVSRSAIPAIVDKLSEWAPHSPAHSKAPHLRVVAGQPEPGAAANDDKPKLVA